MKRTTEQLAAAEWFEATVRAVAPRLRIAADAAGWPLAPGRRGQIEWAGDTKALTVYSTARRLFRPLLAIPGVQRHQTGDAEIRVLLPVDGPHFQAALVAAADLMRVRRRQELTAARKAALDHGRRPIWASAPAAVQPG